MQEVVIIVMCLIMGLVTFWGAKSAISVIKTIKHMKEQKKSNKGKKQPTLKSIKNYNKKVEKLNNEQKTDS